MSENELTPSSGEQMMNCPKCGFEQPVDQYCAKCGVDMAKALRASSGLKGLIKKPAVIAGVTVLLGGFGFAAYKNTAGNSDLVAETLGISSDEQAKSRLSARASSSVVENLNEVENSYASESAANPSANSDPQSQASFVAPPDFGTPSASRKAAKASASATNNPGTGPGAGPGSGASATSSTGMLVVFAWAEVSKDWLLALGATEPGFHQIPGLESKLRQSAGSFRIVDVTRRRLTDDSEPVVITRADQSVFFEPISVKSKALTGGFTAQFKTAQGEIRAPATATASLLDGTGAIVPMGPSASTQGTEIVVFILPRWEND